MTFVASQLVGLFGAHFYLALTSPLTNWLGCSVLDFFTNQLVGLSVASSPAKLGTSSTDSPVGLLRFVNAACHV